MLTLACLKPSQAPHPFSDKIWIFQLILQGLCGQEPALASSESSPSLNHFALAISSFILWWETAKFIPAPGTLHVHQDALAFQSFAQFDGSQSAVLGPAASTLPEKLLEI